MSKVAWVLSGGGSKGSFQSGVMSQLVSQGITPDVIYGTSVGAINACGYSFRGMDGLLKSWFDIKRRGDVLYPSGIQWAWNIHRLFFANGIWSTKPLRKKLETIVSGVSPICEAVSCSVDLGNGEIVYTSNQGDKAAYVDSVLESAAIPLLMEPTNFRVDGGVREQTPLAKAIDDGAEKIYVILCNPWTDGVEPWKPSHWLFPWFYVLYRSVDDLMAHEIFRTDIEQCLFKNKWADKLPEAGLKKIELHVYAPDRVWMDTTEYDPAKIRAAIEAGQKTQELVL